MICGIYRGELPQSDIEHIGRDQFRIWHRDDEQTTEIRHGIRSKYNLNPPFLSVCGSVQTHFSIKNSTFSAWFHKIFCLPRQAFVARFRSEYQPQVGVKRGGAPKLSLFFIFQRRSQLHRAAGKANIFSATDAFNISLRTYAEGIARYFEKCGALQRDPLCPRDVCEGARYKLCGDCKMTYYCSRRCQKKAWPLHKAICNKLKHQYCS